MIYSNNPDSTSKVAQKEDDPGDAGTVIIFSRQDSRFFLLFNGSKDSVNRFPNSIHWHSLSLFLFVLAVIGRRGKPAHADKYHASLINSSSAPCTFGSPHCSQM